MEKKKHKRRLRTLIIPAEYDEIPTAHTSFKGIDMTLALRHNPSWAGDALALKGRLEIPQRAGSGKPACIVDHHGQCVFIRLTQPTAGLKRQFHALNGKSGVFFGRVWRERRDWFIQDPEPMSSTQAGRVRPAYSLHHMTRASLAREHIDALAGSYLEQIKIHNEFARDVRSQTSFAIYLRATIKRLIDRGLKDATSREVALGTRGLVDSRAALRGIMTEIHFPHDRQTLQAAQNQIDRVAAVVVRAPEVKEAVKARRRHLRSIADQNIFRPNAYWLTEQGINELAADLPFTPTAEQTTAVSEILHDMADGPKMRRILSGDVGSGKTVVYALVVKAVAYSSGSVCLMAPRQLLAKQNFAKLDAWLGQVPVGLATGAETTQAPEAKVWVGTQSLAALPFDFDLCIVDEQQLFSRVERERPAGTIGHLLEGTATCIPRSTALTQTGEWAVTRLLRTHVEKHYEHRVYMPNERGLLMSELAGVVEQGQTVLVVYPRLNDGAQLKSGRPAPALKTALNAWYRRFPGKIAYVHGGDTAQQADNDRAIARVAGGEAQILIGTSILEVGIDLPTAERIVVVEPDRFGLSQLHQLRGRVARAGGTGYCDLMLADVPGRRVIERLGYFTRITDGFVLAERDLLIRGSGDASRDGHVQSGKAPKSPFEGHELSSEVMPSVTEELENAYWAYFEVEDAK